MSALQETGKITGNGNAEAPVSPSPKKTADKILAAGILAAVAAGTYVAGQSVESGNTESVSHPGIVSKEAARYPWGEKTLYLFIDSQGNLDEKFSEDKQVFTLEFPNRQQFFVPIFVEPYGENNPSENPFGHVVVEMGEDRLRGGIIFRESSNMGDIVIDASGTTNDIVPPSKILDTLIQVPGSEIA